jgi:hypothetical protein
VSCAALRMSAEVSESQDLGAWTDRCESNAAPSRAKPVAPVHPVWRDYFDVGGDDVPGTLLYYNCALMIT